MVNNLCSCTHEHPEYAGKPYENGQCRVCWLQQNSKCWTKHFNVQTIPAGNNAPDMLNKLQQTGVNVTIVPAKKPQETIDKGPSWFQKMVNFSKAVVTHAWNGLPETPTEEQTKRIAICLTCLPPEGYLNVENGTCNKCGCNILVKAAWAEQKCPIGKW